MRCSFGARLLRNEGLAITRDGATLWVAGVDDRWTKRDDLAAALRDRPHGAPVLLLAHDPASFPEAVAAGVALTLSGHTHGGQIGVRNANLARVAFARSAGLFREGDSALYINRGIGTTGPPVRVGMWPEISLITLRAARS
jgi:predicted MPP superfamily phosphohydrolase